MVWTDAVIHVLDFEGSRRSGILEYGLVTLQGGHVVEAETRLCRPDGSIHQAEIAVHGIEPAAVSGAAPFAEEWEQFCRWRGRGAFAAHFASAENHLLKSVWAYPPPSPDFTDESRTLNDWGPWIDSGRLYENLFPALVSAKLQTLIETFGYQEELDQLAAKHCPAARCGYHSALYDALASAVLLIKLLARPEFAGATLAWLFQMSSGRAARGRAAQQELFDQF